MMTIAILFYFSIGSAISWVLYADGNRLPIPILWQLLADIVQLVGFALLWPLWALWWLYNWWAHREDRRNVGGNVPIRRD